MAERVPPSRDQLTRLLRERRPLTIAESAALTGWPVAEVKRLAAGREAPLRRGRLEWGMVVSWIFDSWPLATLIKILGPHAHLLPSALRPVPMHLEQPGYLVTALRAQWQLDPMPHRRVRPDTFDDYMTDLLHRAIEPCTVAALRDDEEFHRAYEFPYGEEPSE